MTMNSTNGNEAYLATIAHVAEALRRTAQGDEFPNHMAELGHMEVRLADGTSLPEARVIYLMPKAGTTGYVVVSGNDSHFLPEASVRNDGPEGVLEELTSRAAEEVSVPVGELSRGELGEAVYTALASLRL